MPNLPPITPHPDDALPPGLDEGDLLALIEDAPRSARTEAALAAASRDPALARRLAEMKAQRAVLAASAQGLRAPADLLERVGQVLERQALLGLADGTPTSDSLPISVVQPVRRGGVLARITTMTGSMSLGTRAALAAGVMMLVGGAAVVAVLLNARTPAPRLENLAQSTESTGGTGPAPLIEAGPGPHIAGAEGVPSADGATDAARRAALQPAPGENASALALPDPAVTPEAARIARAGAESAEPTAQGAVIASAPAGAEASSATMAASATAELDAQRLTAAREGRLALVARTDRAARGSAALTALAARRHDDWRLREAPAESVVAAVTSHTSPDAPGVALVETSSLPIAVGSAFGLASLDLPVVRASTVEGPPVALAARAASAAARVAEVAATPEALEGLRNAVSERLRTDAEWVELPAQDGLAPGVTQADPLWWTRPPREWAPRVRVPVVVTEQR